MVAVVNGRRHVAPQGLVHTQQVLLHLGVLILGPLLVLAAGLVGGKLLVADNHLFHA